MADLLFGVETEYAITGMSPGGDIDRGGILQRLMERAAQRLIHLPALRSSGIFLQNGARLYVDCGSHPEISTPECSDPWDIVRYIEAGHRILANLAASVESESRPGTEILCFRCNVDYSGTQSTWGCHESYMHRVSLDALQPQIIPHLVSRVIYTGAGGFNPLSRGLEFTLSPRVAHLQQVVSRNSTSERGIWHTKSESLCTGFNRLHVLCGESLCSETATFLKVGVTALIVAMADAGLAPGSAVQLAEPLAAMQDVAGDVTCKKLLKMANGSCRTAIAIQRYYLEQAESQLGESFMPVWAPEVCCRWRTVLDQLEVGPSAVAQTLDWGIKLALYAAHARSLDARWEDFPFWKQVIDRLVSALDACKGRARATPLELAVGPKSPIPKEIASLEPLLQSRGLQWEDLKTFRNCRQHFFEIDTRFGQLGAKGIFQGLDLAGVLNHRVSGADNIEQAMVEPPAKGRAHIRGQVIGRLSGKGNAQCDWQQILNSREGQFLDLSDPFTSEESWHPLPAEKQDPYSLRQEALQQFLIGNYVAAEELLRGLLQEAFEVPSTHCHLARVLLVTNRDEEAREHINRAWDARQQAPAYIVPRILFFQCAYAMVDGADIAAKIAEIKAALNASFAHSEWTTQPLLDHLRSRLGRSNYNFLKVLAEALSDSSAMSRLDEFPLWREAESAA